MTRNHLPKLSDADRAHALELARQARMRYASIKARVKSGELTFTDALSNGDAQRILVRQLLQCVPGIGMTKTDAIMGGLHIAQNRRISGLSSRQREALIELETDGWHISSLA